MPRLRTLATAALLVLATACATAAPTVPDGQRVTAPAPDPGDTIAEPPVHTGSAERGSARLGDLASRGSSTPTSLRIPAIGVEASVLGVGTDDAGDLEVIDDVENVGWYRYGPAPGEPGSAVLAAHVDTARDGPGVFFDLGRLNQDDPIEVELDDGTVATFLVDGLERHAKADLPVEEIFSREGPPRVVLITCGGEFDTSRRSYSDNVVVTATRTGG